MLINSFLSISQGLTESIYSRSIILKNLDLLILINILLLILFYPSFTVWEVYSGVGIGSFHNIRITPVTLLKVSEFIENRCVFAYIFCFSVNKCCWFKFIAIKFKRFFKNDNLYRFLYFIYSLFKK